MRRRGIMIAVAWVTALCGPSATTWSEPTATTAPVRIGASVLAEGRTAREQLREEVDALLKVGTLRPYGLAWSAAPETPGRNAATATVVATFEPAGTPAAGLMLHLSAELLAEPRYAESAVQVARAIAFAMEGAGRVPSTGVMLPGTLSQKEQRGTTPSRTASTAAAGFLLTLDRHLKGTEPRVASGATRVSNWLVKQQLKPGVFPSEVEIPREPYPKRVIRLDIPDQRDGLLTYTLVQLSDSPTSLPTALAKLCADRAIEQVQRFRISDVGKPSRYLWPSAYEFDGKVLSSSPALPPVGNIAATRYALQCLVAYHLMTGDEAALDATKLAVEALTARRGTDGRWDLIDDPTAQYVAPAGATVQGPADGATTVTGWPRSTFALPPTLQTIADLRVLGRATFTRLTSRSLPLDLTAAAILTGLTDDFPTADLPLSARQVDAYIASHPTTFAGLSGPLPIDLDQRVRRLWALYLLASWETRFAAGPHSAGPNTGGPNTGGPASIQNSTSR